MKQKTFLTKIKQVFNFILATEYVSDFMESCLLSDQNPHVCNNGDFVRCYNPESVYPERAK
jgi:hypothetical protein